MDALQSLFRNLPVPAAFALVFWLVACDTCDDCHGVNRDPRVKINFLAVGTLEKTRDTLEYIDESLQTVRDELELETDPDKIDSLENVRNVLLADSTKYAEWEDLFRRGYTHMDLIEGAGAEYPYLDTVVRNFALPLNMHSDSCIFYFVYHDLVDTMKFRYRRNIVQTLDGVRMKLIELEVVRDMTTFDSIRVQCSEDTCSNWGMNIEAYY